MEWVETTGSSLDEAKDRALDQLGVDVSDAEFEVVAEAKSGLFGLGRADARVRARVKPRQPRAKAENRRRRSQGGRRGRSSQGGRDSGGQGKGGQGKGRAKSGSGQGSGSGQRGSKGQKSKNQQSKGAKQGQSDPQSNQDRSNRKSEPQKGRDREQRKEKEPAVTERMDVDEQSEVATEFVQGVVDGFGMDGTANVDVDGETLTVNVAGEGLGLLIGPQGATLRSLEELTRTVLQRRADGRKYHRIRVDVGGYKERRREALEAFTVELADQVRADGVARALEPMPAPDRKIVHDAVIEIDGVNTISEGEDPRRRVVLVPASGD